MMMSGERPPDYKEIAKAILAESHDRDVRWNIGH